MVIKHVSSRILKAAETKKKIYESALELFKRDGFGTSVDSIVEMAGVSKGTFYVHYKSKLSLIIDYVNDLDLGYTDFFTSLPSDIKPSAMLILVTEKITDVIINDIGIDLMKLSYEAQITKTIDIDIQLSYERKLYQNYNQIIKSGVQQGEFKATLDIASVSNHCIMSIRGMTFEWCIRFPDFNLKDEIAKHIDLLFSGIKTSSNS